MNLFEPLLTGEQLVHHRPDQRGALITCGEPHGHCTAVTDDVRCPKCLDALAPASQAPPTTGEQEHLRGPWTAVISYQGDAYDSVRTARIELGHDGEVDISVRRGTAAPDDGYLPGSHHTGDVAYELEYVYLVDPHDPSIGAEARFAQARAMAAGLNDASRSSADDTPPNAATQQMLDRIAVQIRAALDILPPEAGTTPHPYVGVNECLICDQEADAPVHDELDLGSASASASPGGEG